MTTLSEALKFVQTTTNLNELEILAREAQRRRQAIGVAQVRAFRAGDKVKFTTKDGRTVIARFERHMRKNCRVIEERAHGMNTVWTVAPQLLQRAS